MGRSSESSERGVRSEGYDDDADDDKHEIRKGQKDRKRRKKDLKRSH